MRPSETSYPVMLGGGLVFPGPQSPEMLVLHIYKWSTIISIPTFSWMFGIILILVPPISVVLPNFYGILGFWLVAYLL